MQNRSSLNEAQKKAVTHTKGPLLIVAGAGTGKTTVITEKIAHLITENGVSPEEILALTFTEKAATEMEERVDTLLPFGYADVWISTFHAFCEKVLRNHGVDIGLSTDFSLLNDIEQWMLIRNNLERFDLEYYKPRSSPTRAIYAFLKHFSRCKDEHLTPDAYLKYAKALTLKSEDLQGESQEAKKQERDRIREVAHAYSVYQQLLLENNALDFGDLVTYTLELLQQRPAILEHYQKQFKYILVDEFQDTNVSQYELVKLLAADDGNFTVCGDDDQSIYKFRGASVSNVLQFKKDFPKADHVVLKENYRSGQAILDCAYQFIQLNNPDRLEAKEGIDKRLTSTAKERGQVAYIYAKSQASEVQAVINQMIKIKEENPDLLWSDFAILARSNSSASVFCPSLSQAGVPFQFFSLSGLYQKPIILDLIAYLSVLENVHDSPSLYRVLTMPMISFNEYHLSKCTYYARRKAMSLYDVFLEIQLVTGVSKETVSLIQKLVGVIQKHITLSKERPVSELFLQVLHDLGYLTYLASGQAQRGFSNEPDFTLDVEQESPKVLKEREENISYVRQFYDHLREYESNHPDLRLTEFMKQFALEQEAGDAGSMQADDEGPDAVRVMTIHSSKGLEFSYVFIVQMVEQRFPTMNRKDPIQIPETLVKEILPEGDAHLQEERRLLYVAMTRAKQGLFFTFASDYGGLRKKKPSRFLYEAQILKEGAVFEDQTVTESTPMAKPQVIAQEYKPYYQLPKWFSFTQLASFNMCPLQYKFAHILKIPTFGKSVFSYGKTLHNALQKYIQMIIDVHGGMQSQLFTPEKGEGISYPPLKVLLKLYEESWINDWYETTKAQKEAREKGKETLKRFHEHLLSHKPHPIMVEQGFKLKIKDFTLVGSIDRVDKLGDGVEIIDYKTGRSKTQQDLTLDDKMQLLIYQMAAQEVLGLKVNRLTFYYLDDNSAVSFLGEPEEIDTMRQAILEQIGRIHASDFAPTPGFACQFCDFNKICEHRAKT